MNGILPDAEFDASHARFGGAGRSAFVGAWMFGALVSVRAIAPGRSAKDAFDKRWHAAASLVVLASIMSSGTLANAQGADVQARPSEELPPVNVSAPAPKRRNIATTSSRRAEREAQKRQAQVARRPTELPSSVPTSGADSSGSINAGNSGASVAAGGFGRQDRHKARRPAGQRADRPARGHQPARRHDAARHGL
jgi:hypothetical protein